jgi:hypothetical protein
MMWIEKHVKSIIDKLIAIFKNTKHFSIISFDSNTPDTNHVVFFILAVGKWYLTYVLWLPTMVLTH